ncbi:MAG: PAS domain S-box protein [Sediminibacterium sp.]
MIETPFYLAASATTYFVTIDLKGRVIFANELLQQQFPASLVNSPAIDMIMPADEAAFTQTIQQCITAEEGKKILSQFRLRNSETFTKWEFMHGPDAVIIGIGHTITEDPLEKELADSMINSLPCITFLINEEGHKLRWNKKFETVTGYIPEEIKKLHTLDFFDPQDHKRVSDAINDVFTNGTGSVEAEIITKNGQSIPYYFNAGRIQYNGRPCLVGTGLDISLQTKALVEKQENHEKYESLFQQASDPILITDFTGKFIDANASMCKMFGYTKEELLQKRISEIIDPEQLKRQPIRFDLLANGQHIFSHRTMLHKNGTELHVEANVKKFGEGMVMAIVRDLTQRRIIEQNLERSEKNLRHVLSSSVENFYMIDRNYRITLINEAAERNLEKAWGKPVTLGMNVLSMIPEESTEPIRESFDKALAGEKVSYELNIPLQGLPEWVLVNFIPVINDDGTVIGVYVNTKDITGAKQIEGEKESILYQLNERVKELTTLYKISQLIQNDEGPLGSVMQQLVDLLPAGWQYPEITAARIILGEKEVHTANFTQGIHKQTATCRTSDGTELIIEVVYLEARPMETEDAFFAEERYLINLIADMFCVYLNRKEEAASLKKSEANLNTIFDSTDTIYVLMDSNFQIMSYNKPAADFAAKELGHNMHISDSFMEYFPNERRSVLLGQLKKAFGGAYVNYETSYQQSDGNFNWYDVRIFPIAGSDGQLFGIMMAVSDITEKKVLEQELLDQKVQEQKKITRAMIKAQEKERNRIGQELHDNVNQILAGTKMFLTSAAKKDNKVMELVKYPLELIDNTISEIRSLSTRQVTPLRNIDLQELVQSLLVDLRKNTSIETDFIYTVPSESMDDDLKLNIYRIIQEQITNIVKHAHPKKISITVECVDGSINIVVADDGKGFDTGKKRKGIGISNMINRVESFNGSVSIESSPGNGCRLNISLPY